MDGFESDLEEFYDDFESNNDYFSADESLEESWDVSCQSFQNGAQGVVGSEKSTLSCCAIKGSGKRRSSFGKDIDTLYVSNSKSSVSDLTLSNLAGQGEVDKVKSLSTPIIQKSVLKNTAERSRLSKSFRLVDELHNESTLSSSDEVNLHTNIWLILTDRLVYSSQDEKLVRNETKVIYT